MHGSLVTDGNRATAGVGDSRLSGDTAFSVVSSDGRNSLYNRRLHHGSELVALHDTVIIIDLRQVKSNQLMLRVYPEQRAGVAAPAILSSCVLDSPTSSGVRANGSTDWAWAGATKVKTTMISANRRQIVITDIPS